MAASLNWGAACESHSPPALFAGDDWNVVATFTDAAGNPLDLTGATIMWALLDRNGKAVFVAADFTVAVGPQPGQCTLTVPAASTTKLSGGSYNDAWRMVAAGVTTTLVYGSVNVQADPWGAAAQPAAEAAPRVAGAASHSSGRPQIKVASLARAA